MERQLTTSPVPAESGEIWLVMDSRSIGGIENHVFILADELRRHGLNAVVVLMADYGSSPNINRMKRLNIPYRLCQNTQDFLRQLKAHPPLLLHSHGYKAGIICRLLGRWYGCKVVSTFHSGDLGRGRVRWYSLIDLATAFLGRRIAVSRAIARRLPPPVTVIANFVSLPPRAAVQPKPAFRVGFVGRLSHEKGPDLFCSLAALHPRAEFHVYGDGPMRSALEADYLGHVEFHGFCADMSEVWPQIDLLCITSRAEGLPLAALEAMANGIPVCSFAIGGLGDLITHGDNGWLLPAGDLNAMSQALHEWQQLTTAEYRRRQQCARETIRQHYTPETALPQIIAVYQRALGPQASRLHG